MIFSCIFFFVFILLLLRGKNLLTKKITLATQDALARIGVGEGFPLKYEGTKVEIKNFKASDGDVFVLSDTSFACFNNFSKKIFLRSHGLDSPVLKVKKTHSLIYNSHGNNFKINLRSKEVCSQKLSESIIAGDISESGRYVFATDSNGRESHSKVSVFDENFEKIFEYNVSDCFVTNVAISENATMIAISGVFVNNGTLFSVVYVFDLKKEDPKVRFEYEDVLFLEINFLENSNIMCVSDKLLTSINPSLNKKTDIAYEEKQLNCFNINNKGAALCLSSVGSTECELLLINKNAVAFRSILAGSNIYCIDYNGNVIAALKDSQLDIYASSGKKIKNFSVNEDTKSISLASSNRIYLLGLSEISNLDFG